MWPRPEGELRQRGLWVGVCLCACKLGCELLPSPEAAVGTPVPRHCSSCTRHPAASEASHGLVSRADTSSVWFSSGPRTPPPEAGLLLTGKWEWEQC